MAIISATRTTLDDDDDDADVADDVDVNFTFVVVAVGTDQCIVYNQSKYCSFRPRVSGSTPGAGKSMPAGMPERPGLSTANVFSQ